MKYIFITPSIRNVGGAELYISRKVRWLQEKKWEVEIYYQHAGEILIDNLKVFKNYLLPELCIPFQQASAREKKKFLSHFKFDQEECIIESHIIELGLWAEYAASKLHAKHICYLLSENFPNLHELQKAFLHFKFDQQLLYGIHKSLIPRIVPEAVNGESTVLHAVGCTESVIADIEWKRPISVKTSDYSILSLGRLEKPYIPSMINAIQKFAIKYSEKTIVLYVVGSSPDQSKIEAFHAGFTAMPNVQLVMLGYMFPLPTKLLDLVDVSIASSGSAGVTGDYGIPTITIDAESFKGLGVYPYTTRNRLFRSTEEEKEIIDLLEECLIQQKYPKKHNAPCRELDYSKHLAIINKSFEPKWFDMGNLYRTKIDCRNFVLETILGHSFLYIVKRIFRKVVKIGICSFK